MEREEKILFLENFRAKIELLNSLYDKLNTLVYGMENCKPIDYSGMPRGGVSTDIADKLAKKEELEKRIEKQIEKISETKKSLIDEIDDNIIDVKINNAMFMYWVEGCSKNDIAETIGKSVRQVDRYLSDGIEMILNSGLKIAHNPTTIREKEKLIEYGA